MMEDKELLKILTCGSVDDGKSTLIGHLLFDSKLVYTDQIENVKRESYQTGNTINYALLLDGLKAEKEQGITIDVAYRYFATDKRKFIVADCPGHIQYTRNMATGASNADLAIILINASHGIMEQTKRHTDIVKLLGIKDIIVVINKMDLVGYSYSIYQSIIDDYNQLVNDIQLHSLQFIPVSATKGDNITELSKNTPYYHEESLLHYLENICIQHEDSSFRCSVQYVNVKDTTRYYCGKVSSGVLHIGDTIKILPSNQTSKVKHILNGFDYVDSCKRNESISIVIEDDIDISRGDMIIKSNDTNYFVNHYMTSKLLWMDDNPFDYHKSYYLKMNHNTIRCSIDCNDHIEVNGIYNVKCILQRNIAFDKFINNRETGSFILIDPITNNTVALGICTDELKNDNENDPEYLFTQYGKDIFDKLLNKYHTIDKIYSVL